MTDNEFHTRTEYLAAQLGTIDDEHDLTEYGLLNHGRGAHIVVPDNDADRTVPTIRKSIRTVGGKANVFEDGGLTLTNTWSRGDKIVLRVELDTDYEWLFNTVERLQALPYFDQEDVAVREPPARGIVTFELVLRYDMEDDNRTTSGKHGRLNQEVWSLLDNFEVNRMNVADGVVNITCHPIDERFIPGD